MSEDVLISNNVDIRQKLEQHQEKETPKVSYQNISDLPQDIRDRLPEDAQHIFMTAFNSIMDNSGDEETAARVAWNTIERDENYRRCSNSKWERITQTSEGSSFTQRSVHDC